MNDRKALEREIHEWLSYRTVFSIPLGILEEVIYGWLDKQAAITEREFMENWDAPNRLEVHALAREIAELRLSNESLKTELNRVESLRDAWIDKFQRRNDEYIEVRDHRDRLKTENAKLRDENKGLENGYIQAQDAKKAVIAKNFELFEQNKKLIEERERYRELFGKSLDFAGEIIDLGLELDEGLA